jgi:hypothetical protein
MSRFARVLGAASASVLAILSSVVAADAQLLDLTGTWSVKAKLCGGNNTQVVGSDISTSCTTFPPPQITVQSLGQYTLVIYDGSRKFKCAITSSADGGKAYLACATCGSENLDAPFLVDDDEKRFTTLAGKASAKSMKLNFAFASAFDAHGDPGVQPGVQVSFGTWSAKRIDSISPGLTDCP